MAVNPLTVSAIASAVPAAYQLGSGLVQGVRGMLLGGRRRPRYRIPKEITENVGLAQGAFNASSRYGLPGQGRMEDRLRGSQAASMQAIQQSQQSPAAMLTGFAAVDQNTKNALADMGVRAADFRQQNMDANMRTLMSAKNALAQYRDREFKMNRMQPWQQAMAASGALRNSAMQNIYGGLSSAANTVGAYVNRNNPMQTAGARMAGGIADNSGGGVAAQGFDAVIEALTSQPEFAGMTRDQIAQALQQLLIK